MSKVLNLRRFRLVHLTEKLDLDTIARAVGYSKYHLHRLFSQTIGMTMHDYLQRRQLTEAAKLLVFSNKSILDIALLAGYESQQAFHNAFKAMYKQAPNKYRELEKFYPLQLRFDFAERVYRLDKDNEINWSVNYATSEDIPSWMELVRLVIDGFPNLQEHEYLEVLQQQIEQGQALIVRDKKVVIGIMLFTAATGSIDFMGVHPLYRQRGVPRVFLDKLLGELPDAQQQLSITTYRQGDRADIGHRRQLQELGFAEAELLVEFGYPTQRFIWTRGSESDRETTKRK